MASGAILGKCPVCKEFIWEDEDYTVEEDFMKHRECCNDDMSSMSIIFMKLTKMQKKRMVSLLEGLIKSDEYKE